MFLKNQRRTKNLMEMNRAVLGGEYAPLIKLLRGERMLFLVFR